ncbi:hypothetical protein [Corynebacterium sp. HS2168-gen11]|uniref:hypothetical protein n=1 Tax=Corynebacterium sp. HS2168-gen11 TaxID=2974027 RepID=UPI00216B1131|nr:hypothetical protein [Corynebacterium sp. HS2168-gen11]MCS4536409.1 hypothetical protein [Corynebacterium sp. HS2168-gen11]
MKPSVLIDRVAEEARPPAEWGREGIIPDLSLEVLLDDLVKSHAWLARELKEPFLALWVNEPKFDNPDLDDFVEEITYNNLFAFAAMDPVVDLESLREPKTT